LLSVLIVGCVIRVFGGGICETAECC